MEKVGKKKKRAGRYPWKEWFNRPKFVLTRGIDYKCHPHGMAQMARNQATSLGLKVHVTVTEDSVEVQVKGVKP